MYDYINTHLIRLESRFGLRLSAVIIGLGLLVCAGIYVRPGYRTDSALGQFYADLSRHPFSSETPNLVGYRFLTPLVSYLIGLRGGLIVVTNLLFAAILLVAVYYYFRRLTPHPADAFITSCTVAFSLVTLTTVYYSGFCDSLTYLLIFLMWVWRDKTVLFWLLFMLGIFNRESMIFLLPWLLYIRCNQGKLNRREVARDFVGLAIVGAIVTVFRWWQSENMKIEYDAAFYFRPLLKDLTYFFRMSFPESILGFTTVYKVLWAIPVVAGVQLWRNGNRREVAGWILLLLCSAAQLMIAFDSSRLFTMSFMIVPLAMVALFQSGEKKHRAWIFPLLLCNFIAPAYYTAEHIVEHMRLLPDTLFRVLIQGKGW